jgi:hypothetical protein
MNYFSCSGRPGVACTKPHPDTLRQTFVFASSWICGILVRPVREASMHYISSSAWTSMDSTECASGHITPNFCFRIWCDMRVMLCIVVLSGREMSTHYFSCAGGPTAVCTKRVHGHVTSNLCFCILCDHRVT